MKRVLAVVPLLVSFLSMPASAGEPEERERERNYPAPIKAFAFSGELVLGATPGGAQDIAYFRDRVVAGEVPHPNVFTPEGLFSEHDLPVRANGACRQLLCMAGEATEAALIVQPEVRYLAQVGFDTGLDPKTWKRAALNLVAVIDKSGSMSGQPLELVKESLRQVVSQLRPDDQISIVLYGDRSHVHLAPTPLTRKEAALAAIDVITSAGSTAMEEGLKVGYQVSRETRRRFEGSTRLMLFTDERPNVGAVDAESFMGMAEAASREGIGLTTIGVGVQFGAELATKIASVRGGNLFFFPDLAKMQKTFQDELDTMVTELAYDLEMTIAPARGLKIAGVYGVPGQVLQWTQDGGIALRISTIFLSRKDGAIYVAFAGAGSDALPAQRMPVGSDLGWAKVGYTPRGGKPETSEVVFTMADPKGASIGLRRGVLLVDEATTLKAAATKHHTDNDQEGAYQLVHALASLFRQTKDPDLASEQTMLGALEATLAKLSGHQGEPPPLPKRAPVDPVSGLPR